MARPTFKRLRAKALARPAVKAEYEALGPLYDMKRRMIALRMKTGLTQNQVAEKLATKKSNISRLESLASNASPRLSTIENYAHALGYRMKLSFERR